MREIMDLIVASRFYWVFNLLNKGLSNFRCSIEILKVKRTDWDAFIR